ncbi:MAG: HAMP domain-containing sensor histidine kinase, partial [Pseudomonadota bacterium]
RGTVLDERHRLVVAKPRGLGQLIARESMAGNARRLVFIVTPLGLLMGLALSWRTVRRLDGLGAAFDRVGSGALQERIPISSRNDEFDRLADRFNQMLVRLAALQDNLEDVSVGVAHDLRTPIARLGQRLQRIRQDFDEPERIAAHLDVADEEVASIIRTFEALLRMGEINSGQRRERFRSVDLSHVVEELARSYAAVFETEERSLAISVVPGVLILGDEDLIAQLLGNLLDNSIEHGDPGGETWVRLQTSALGALLQIGDDGPGIGANLHERVFERFVRGDAARSSPGNGLGLSLVKAIAELHDASIVLQRGVPGTVIDVEFPRASGRGRRTSAT